MLKYQTWYALMWITILVLYSLEWSSLNSQLYMPLVGFFVLSVLIAMFMSAWCTRVAVKKIRWTRKRRPIITFVLVLGYLADWAYQGNVPILRPYQGYDPNSTAYLTVGIPYLHVLIISVSLFYMMYLSYLYFSDRKQRTYLFEFLVLISILVLNNSRGFVVFCLAVALLLFVSINGFSIKNLKISILFFIVIATVAIIFFISVMGNIRSGFRWNDCSYIESIGRFDNYPVWLSKHFMWFYSYATSPLANLNLNSMLYDGANNMKALIYCFFPEKISSGYLSVALDPQYMMSALNATTGYASFVCSAGILGLYVAFAGTIAYYSILKMVLKRTVVLETFGNAVLCLLTSVMVFYNAFAVSALCYFPLFLIVAALWMKRKMQKGQVVIENVGFAQSSRDDLFSKVHTKAKPTLQLVKKKIIS